MSIGRSVLKAVHNECTKEKPMIDHDNLEDFRDAELYDLQHEGYYDEYPLTEQWARWYASCPERHTISPRPPTH
jgi:hypothetical protein